MISAQVKREVTSAQGFRWGAAGCLGGLRGWVGDFGSLKWGHFDVFGSLHLCS